MNTRNIQMLLSKNAPDILLTAGVVSIIGGGILAIKQTPKALKILENKKEDTNLEKAKSLAPLYVAPVVLTGMGISSIVCSRNMTNKKIAAMATAYTVSETALRTYREKVKELVEPEKYEEIKKEVANETLRKNPIENKEVYMTSKPDSLIYDEASGRYFRGNIDDIKQVVNMLNKRMMNDMSVQLNEFYAEIGLDPIKLGVDMGWSIDHELIEVSFDGGIADNNEPCIVLRYDTTWI